MDNKLIQRLALFNKGINVDAQLFIQDLVNSYIDELNHYTEHFGEDIPVINYGERCQVGFMATGLSNTHNRDKYATVMEYKTSSCNAFVDLGVLRKKSSKKQFFLIEAKYYYSENYNFSALEYKKSEFDAFVNQGIDQLNFYNLADKAFCVEHNAIGISIILHPFFNEQEKEVQLSEYGNEEKWEKINLANYKRNYLSIRDNPDRYYFLYETKHHKKNNIETVGFEIFGTVVDFSSVVEEK